jgi:putative endonuclease
MKKPLKSKIAAYNSGKIAELLCRLFMRLHGYRILVKNYHCGTGRKTAFGELDFVALKGREIVFCEVKKRQNSEDFLKALSYNQQQRIIRGGIYFIDHHKKYQLYSRRYDVFFVKFPFHIEWIKNALTG